MRFFYFLLLIGMLFALADPALAQKKHKKKKPTITYAQAYSPYSSKNILPVLYGSDQLAEQINKVIRAESANTDIAVFVKSMEYGDVLYSRNINQPLTPASTLKVLTAEAALIFLGADYRFSTQLLTDAKSIKNGVLQGNLYIVLSGDPTLTYNDIVELLLNLKNQQIHTIAGNVYIDNTAYDQRFYGPGWVSKDKTYCYGAPISASIINHNCLSFQVTPSKVTGKPVQVLTSSKYFYPAIRNSVITKASKRACSMRLTTDPNSMISIDGCMGKGRYAWGVSYVVTDIPEYNRNLFKNSLSRLGVSVYGKVTFGSASNRLSFIGSHQSKPLKLLITDMLKKSDNIIAGALFKKLGQLYTKQPGSWENGSLAVSKILAEHAGVNTSGLRVLDGSGLSLDNLTTSSQMMQVLNYAYHHPLIRQEFIAALPVAGVDGTLKHRMAHLARKIKAKTGTLPMSGIVSLAGYAETQNKEQLAFVIMINGSKGRAWRYKSLEDKIVTALTKFRRAAT